MRAFDKIIGYDSVKNELYQVIDMFKNREMYEKIGAKLPRGVLLYGRPGLGKTMLASSLIEECNVKSFILRKNKSDEKIIEEINKTFEEASKLEQAIILIDDIDKFSDTEDDDVDAESYVTIQSCIDKCKDSNILIIATANNKRKLPGSLLRSGRFDIKIELKAPTDSDAEKIIEFYLKSKNVSDKLNFEDVSKMFKYKSCADLESIINLSAIYATFKRKESIEIDDIVKAYLKSADIETDENYKCDKNELELISLHEAGHAVISEAIKEGSVGFVYIPQNGRNSVGGFTNLCKEFRRRPEHVLIALGGKIAVELFYGGRCASGCGDDLDKATDLLTGGITESGTCGLGLLDVSGPNPASDNYRAGKEYAIKAELERFMFLARDIILKNKDFLLKMTEILKEKHMLLYSDIKEIRNSVKVTPAVVQ